MLLLYTQNRDISNGDDTKSITERQSDFGGSWTVHKKSTTNCTCRSGFQTAPADLFSKLHLSSDSNSDTKYARQRSSNSARDYKNSQGWLTTTRVDLSSLGKVYGWNFYLLVNSQVRLRLFYICVWCMYDNNDDTSDSNDVQVYLLQSEPETLLLAWFKWFRRVLYTQMCRIHRCVH